MLLKHLENIQGKSENYRMAYALTVSIFFTGIIAGLWGFSFFIPNINGVSNSASAGVAVDTSGLSPIGIVRQEIGSVFGSLVDSIKGVASKPFLGDKYKVKFDDGTLSLSENNSTSTLSADGLSSAPLTENAKTVISTTTSSGFTVEAEGTDSGLEN